MTTDEIASPTSLSNSSRRIRVRPAKKASISQEVVLPSAPSDDNEDDWVSPFTLPPLPAFRKNRSQVDRSPEDRHTRAGSSAYYASAWGSPYATPSPAQSPATRVTRNRSLDLESSPLASRKRLVATDRSPRHTRLRSLPTEDPALSSDRAPSTNSIDSQKDSQRRNWLSESEDSNSDSESEKLSTKTPTQRKFVDVPSSVRSHHVQESVDTVTPETFNGSSSIVPELGREEDTGHFAMSGPTTLSFTPAGQKPLPSLPLDSPQPPFLNPTLSFQRMRKKVPWHNKSCIISLPATNRDHAGLPPVLTPDERKSRLQEWVDSGYPVHGFNIGDWYSTSHDVTGSSRPTFPDPMDIELDRKASKVNVRVPIHGEWEAWVEYLREEKLRALGVTPNTSEAAPSTASPFSSTISRVSSAYPSMAPTPPIPAMSAASLRQQRTHSPYSPSISISNPAYAALSQRGTPGLTHPRGMHGYTQSIAIPGVGQRIGSPFDYLNAQQNGYGANIRSPSGQMPDRRAWTPGHVQGMQSMANIISPAMQSPHDFNRGYFPHPQQIQFMQRQQEAAARQQQEVQAQIARHHQRQMSMFPMRQASTEHVRQLPHTPQAISPEREPPEIMHPTPRSHRHNLSAALEKGVTDSVVASSKGLNQVVEDSVNDKKRDTSNNELEDGEVVEDKDQDDLPILHRPETLKDIDENAEIETNPSIASTPLLLNEHNPFSNFKPLPPPETSVKRPGFGHVSKPSLSMLNVQAKEFSPSKPSFTPAASVFNFDGNAFVSPNSSPSRSAVAGPKFGHKHNPSSLGLNVTASVFTPAFTTKPIRHNPLSDSVISFEKVPIETVVEESKVDEDRAASRAGLNSTKTTFDPRSSAYSFGTGNNATAVTPAKSVFDPRSSAFSTFSFGSTSLNVDAPEFKPSGISLSSIDFTPEKLMNFTGKIFGDVNIEPSTKSERRTKAVPITKPASREGSAAPEPQENFGTDGRAMAPVDRNKRVRTMEAENEEVLFADSAPFKSLDEDERHGENQITKEDPAKLIKSDGEKEMLIVNSQDSSKSTNIEGSPNEEEKTSNDLNEMEPTGIEQTDSHQETPSTNIEEANPSSPTNGEVVLDTKLSELVSDVQSEVSSTMNKDRGVVETSHSTLKESADVDFESAKPTTPIASSTADIKASDKTTANASINQPSLSAIAPAFQPLGGDKAKTELSAAAPAFKYQPVAQSFVPAIQVRTLQPEMKAVKANKEGLRASRFAASISPKPQEMETFTKSVPLFNEVKEETDNLFDEPAVEATFDVAAMGAAGMSAEADIIDTLEKYRESDSRTGSALSKTAELSYEEINAVMQQFEDDPDLGVIRDDTPVKPTPLIDMRYPQPFRSDAPSPSPTRRLQKPVNIGRRQYEGLGFDISGVHQLNYNGSDDISDWNAELSADLSPGQQDKLEARAHFFDDHVNDIVDNILENRLAPLEKALQGIQASIQATSKVRHSRRSMSTDNKHSDADDEDDYDAYEGYAHYRSRSPHKRDRRHERIKVAMLEAISVAQENFVPHKLDTTVIEKSLNEIREFAQKGSNPPSQAPFDLAGLQETLAELRSIARQEPKAPALDLHEFTGVVAEMKSALQQRAPEPQFDMVSIQAVLNEIRDLSAERPKAPSIDLSAIHSALTGLKTDADAKSLDAPANFKSILEEVISSHPKLNEPRVEQEHETAQKYQARIDELEEKLRAAEVLAKGEVLLRSEAEEDRERALRDLTDSQDLAKSLKAASAKSQRELEAVTQEKAHHRTIDTEVRDLHLKNEALEATLDEYRSFKEQITGELESERGRTDNLARALHDASQQHRDQLGSRDALQSQLSRVQERMTQAIQDIHHDEAEWRKREHDLLSKNQLLQASLDHETNRRARLELDSEKLGKEHREGLQYKSKYEDTREEVIRLVASIADLQTDNKLHKDATFQAQRELAFNQEKHDGILDNRTASLQTELDASKSSLEKLQTEADATIARLQGQLNNATTDLHDAQKRHDANMSKMFENHNNAMRSIEEKHAVELEHRLASHEDKLIDLKHRYARDVANATEDRKASEHRYTEKLGLSNDKVVYLESKTKDLEERLEVTRDAARAAAVAAAKHINLPTPAASVIASPPHRASIGSASVSTIRGTDLPEKISPQALRETIMVLQDQLQNREQKLDRLESELAAIDKDAPGKVRDRDTEIVMLRELLEVRVDDLQELINTLEMPDYDAAAVADAAIRLRTQIRMEQQLKERAITSVSTANNLPASITSGIVNLTQSPRAMVAAAAWGNWRRVRDSGVGAAVSDFATNIGAQTPTRVSSSSSATLKSAQTPLSPGRSLADSSRQSTTRALTSAAATRKSTGPGSPSSGARPLRAFNSQPRTMTGARPLARRGTNESLPAESSRARRYSNAKVNTPSTPLQIAIESDFGEDVDDDASPLDGKDQGFDPQAVTTPKSPRMITNIAKTRKSRSSFGKPVSPRALRAAAPISPDEYVEVIEED